MKSAAVALAALIAPALFLVVGCESPGVHDETARSRRSVHPEAWNVPAQTNLAAVSSREEMLTKIRPEATTVAASNTRSRSDRTVPASAPRPGTESPPAATEAPAPGPTPGTEGPARVVTETAPPSGTDAAPPAATESWPPAEQGPPASGGWTSPR